MGFLNKIGEIAAGATIKLTLKRVFTSKRDEAFDVFKDNVIALDAYIHNAKDKGLFVDWVEALVLLLCLDCLKPYIGKGTTVEEAFECLEREYSQCNSTQQTFILKAVAYKLGRAMLREDGDSSMIDIQDIVSILPKSIVNQYAYDDDDLTEDSKYRLRLEYYRIMNPNCIK